MSIIIKNIDDWPRPYGPHLYEVRINLQRICLFQHNREDDLATCLRKAADAAGAANLREEDTDAMEL